MFTSEVWDQSAGEVGGKHPDFMLTRLKNYVWNHECLLLSLFSQVLRSYLLMKYTVSATCVEISKGFHTKERNPSLHDDEFDISLKHKAINRNKGS